MNVKETLKNEIAASLNKLLPNKNINGESILIEFPENLDYGDFSTNSAMVFFKQAGSESGYKSPRDFAEALINDLNASKNLSKYIETIQVAGPGFINFKLRGLYFAEMLSLINSDIGLFAKPVQVKSKASLEHTQMNPNKDLHVGHLRNSCIGDSVVKLLGFSGRDVTVQYYQNDAGLQISSIVLAYKEKFIKPEDFQKLHKWAAVAYVDIESRIETNEGLVQKRADIQVNISKQNNEDARLAKKLTDEILRNVLETMSDLGVYFDLVVCESDILKDQIWDQAFEILKKSDSFYQAKEGKQEGCWLVKMPNAEDKIFVRANGIPNYVATDFAYELWKFGQLKDFKYKEFPLNFYKKQLDITSSDGDTKNGYNNADEVYLVVDVTQSYPQQSIVEALNVLGYKKEASNYHHIAYGFVYLSEKTANKLGIEIEDSTKPIKMSGRKGTVVSVDTFLEKVETALIEKFGDFSSLKEVRNGAIKFEMLKNNTYQDMVFDLEAAIDNKGFTGPYIQYTYARAMSVLKKSKNVVTIEALEVDFDDAELKLLKEINKLPDEIQRAIDELSPHYICHYMYSVAQAYNAFYNSNQIIGSEKESFRVAVTQSVANVLELGLSLLGIKAPESM